MATATDVQDALGTVAEAIIPGFSEAMEPEADAEEAAEQLETPQPAEPEKPEPTDELTRLREELADLKETLEYIEDAERIATLKESEWLSMKERTKEAKEDFDAAQNEVSRRVREARGQKQHLPLFDGPEVSSESRTAAEVREEAWRVVPLEQLGLSADAVKAFTAAKLETLGAIADVANANDGHFTSIKCIGPVTDMEINEALGKWWSEHPEHVPGSWAEARQALREAGGDAWDKVENPQALIDELRGKPDWRSVPISELKLSNSCSVLSKAGIENLGQMADYAQANNGLDGLEGMTAKRLKHINERFQQWKDANPDLAYQLEAAASDPVADAMSLADEIEELAGEVIRSAPQDGKEFAQSVRAQAADVLATIKETGHVTDAQAEALQNWRDGLAKWVRE